ncbi:hypothetical protein U1Q18_012984 [Sarracenia purpurea var. burkii]
MGKAPSSSSGSGLGRLSFKRLKILSRYGAQEKSSSFGVPLAKRPCVTRSKDKELSREKQNPIVDQREGVSSDVPSKTELVVSSLIRVAPNFDRDKGKGVSEPGRGASVSWERQPRLRFPFRRLKAYEFSNPERRSKTNSGIDKGPPLDSSALTPSHRRRTGQRPPISTQNESTDPSRARIGKENKSRKLKNYFSGLTRVEETILFLFFPLFLLTGWLFAGKKSRTTLGSPCAGSGSNKNGLWDAAKLRNSDPNCVKKDPGDRYVRDNGILGKDSFKTVY